VAISLREHSFTHEVEMVDLQDKPANFTSLYTVACADETARAKVPVLEVGDDVLIESMVICEYLDEMANSEVAAIDKANARLFAALAQPALSMIPILKAEPGSLEEEKAVQDVCDKLIALDRYLENHASSDGPFLLGQSFSIAECALAPFAQRFATVLPGLRPDLDPYALISDRGLARLGVWLKAVTNRDSCVATLPPAKELVQSYSRLIDRMKAMPA